MEQLPLLPLPELDDTIKKYLVTVKPFLQQEDYSRTAELANQFAQSEIGLELQRRLVKRAESAKAVKPWRLRFAGDGEEPSAPQDKPTKSSWLVDWWNSYSYLRYREPVVLNVSFFFVFKRMGHTDALLRAAMTAHYALQFKQQMLDGTLAPDTVRNQKQCMQQYQFMFNACRVPAQPEDFVDVYEPAACRHFVVAYRNQYFVVQEVDSRGKIWSVASLFMALEKLVAEYTESHVAIGVLTAADRDSWTHYYKQLQPGNLESLQLLKSASFLLCLDLDSLPLTREELAHMCWHNHGQNRWYDKSLQFIVFGNGHAGFLGEHSMQDATTPARLCDYICQMSQSHSVEAVDGTIDGPNCQPLKFLLSQELLLAAEQELQQLAKHVADHDVQILHYSNYGKAFIKSLQMSPDSYVQMAIQLGYYLMNRQTCATYESAGMKRYQWGRTETCRSVSQQSVDFCHAMDDLTRSVTQRQQLMRAAVQTHSQYMTECLQGAGIDRHFLGLRLSLKDGEPLPAFFAGPVYNLSCHWTLSTSQIASEYFSGYGWGEVVRDGYGVAYMVREDALEFNIAGLIGDTVPDLEMSEQQDRGKYFVKHYKQMRVAWLKACIELALDQLHELFTAEVDGKVQQAIPQPSTVPVTNMTASQKSSHKSVTHMSSSSSIPQHIGLSLAYPQRVDSRDIYQPQLTGVMQDDLGLIDFELEWGARRTGDVSRGTKLLRMFKDLIMTPSMPRDASTDDL